MTDDLVKRLRGPMPFDKDKVGVASILMAVSREREEAADRIEALEQRLDATKDKAEAAIIDLMSKLGKAVEALRDLTDCVDDGYLCSEIRMATVMYKARAVLAEIEGGKDG